MSRINILTSGFPNGFTPEFSNKLHKFIINKRNFVFVASDFDKTRYEKTDRYFDIFLKQFSGCGIEFENKCVVDSGMCRKAAQEAVSSADVLWLAGGDTIIQYKYIESYGLKTVIQNAECVTIGMSAGSMNMAKTTVCARSSNDYSEFEIYEGLGLVDISVAPHFNMELVTDGLLEISGKYPIHGMCDDSAIIVNDSHITYLGDVFLIDKGNVSQIKTIGDERNV